MSRNTNNLEGRAGAELGVQLLEAINRWAPIEEMIALIEQGADVNIQDRDGWTSLYRACLRNNTQLTALLIEHGADVNIRNNDGWTPLQGACYYNINELTLFLLDHGAEVDLSLLKAFVRYDEEVQIDAIIDNQPPEPIQLHLRPGADVRILDILYFPSDYAGLIQLIGNDGNEIELHFEQGYLLK